VSEATPAVPASEPNPAPTPGENGVPATTVPPAVTPPASDTFAAEREQYESRVRSFQSEADQAKARAEKLESELAALRGGSTPTTPTAQASADEMFDVFERRQAVREAGATLKTEFPEVARLRPDLFSDPKGYDSPEAFRAAVEQARTELKPALDEIVGQRESALVERYRKAFGDLPDTPPGTESTAAGTEPTPEQVKRWSMSEMDAYAVKHGEEALARLLSSVS
jgi:hypothetical protein